jgi:EAL domain-containing protein (putative c-di-GMP-specific phosphodiesterase class I)
MNAVVSERMTMINSLRMADQRGEFFLHFQPQINAKTHEVIRIEALLRWTNPELGVVPPTKFIPLLEETGLIVPVGEWVLRKACQQNNIWIKAGLPPLPISVNISARQLRQKNLANTVTDILDEVGLDSQYLQIEITESALVENSDATFTTLQALHESGVRIAIDDFGSGYSSLTYLKEFPLDILKLDNSFIKGISTSTDDAAIVEAIIGLGHSLRLKVVAEGVETEEQLSFLRDRGCDEMQGFIFSSPLDSEDCEKWLRREMSKIATRAAR